MLWRFLIPVLRTHTAPIVHIAGVHCDRVGNFGPARYTSADIADKADEDGLALLEPHEATRLRSKYERAGALDPAAGTGPSP